MNKLDPQPLTSIDEDFALWSAEQAALLTAGKFDRLDIENLVGELDYLGNSQKNEIVSRLGVLMAHMLKWQFQPSKRSNSWRATLMVQRREIARTIKRSPSLKNYPSLVYLDEYELAVLNASGDTGLPLDAFPETCPYSIEQILDPEFLPGEL